MTFVIDASVAVKWFVKEDNRDKARELLRDGFVRLAPDLIFVEVANALRKKAVLRQISVSQAIVALDDLSVYLPNVVANVVIIHDAFSLALELEHPVADCLYLACARHSGGQLVSADEQFLAKCRQKYAPFVLSLAEVTLAGADASALSIAFDKQAIDKLVGLLAIFQQTDLSIGRHWFEGDVVNLGRQRLAQEIRGLSPEQVAHLTAACWLGANNFRERSESTLRHTWLQHLERARSTRASNPEDDLIYTMSQLQNLEIGLSLLSRLGAFPQQT